ncbi:PP5 [Symbiodinium sp. CCMP2592]|nr:PP5 [Symbiodinium sp. CCMP2592]
METRRSKLGLVKKEGSAPRLVGDSTVSGANLLCRIGERIEMPSLHDVAEFLLRYPDEQWISFIMDVAKAHKRVKVAQEVQGYSLCAVIDKHGHGRRRWLCYATSATCHLGCSWAAYWWSRAAARFVRLGHRLLRHRHFLAMYVDDLLGLLRRGKAGAMPVCLSASLGPLGLPPSLRKLRLGTALKWDCVGSPMCHLRLDAGCGSCFASYTSPQRALQRLLTSSGQVQSAISSPAISAGWHVLEVNHQKWSAVVDLQQHAGTSGSAWVKLGDSDSKLVRVSSQAASAARFYYDLMRLRVAVHLVETTGPRLVAAADAFADGRKAGVGGWWLRPGCELRPENICWFSYAITAEELPEWFVSSQGMESVICALEALAQLILCALILRHCDNTAVVGAVAKGSSMTPALAGVLQATAKLCLRHGIALKISHVDPALWKRLDGSKRRYLDWSQLLSCSSEMAQVPGHQIDECRFSGAFCVGLRTARVCYLNVSEWQRQGSGPRVEWHLVKAAKHFWQRLRFGRVTTGPDVTSSFCEKNNLQCIIRSHEVKADGYRWDHKQLLSVFSAPNYLDTGNNKGAFLKLTKSADGSVAIDPVSYAAVPHPDVPPMKWQDHITQNYSHLTRLMKKKVSATAFDEFGDSDFEGLMNFDEWEPDEAEQFQEAFKVDQYGRDL